MTNEVKRKEVLQELLKPNLVKKKLHCVSFSVCESTESSLEQLAVLYNSSLSGMLRLVLLNFLSQVIVNDNKFQPPSLEDFDFIKEQKGKKDVRIHLADYPFEKLTKISILNARTKSILATFACLSFIKEKQSFLSGSVDYDLSPFYLNFNVGNNAKI